MKRTLSVLLSFIFICSLFTGIDIQSVGAITKSEFDNKISALRSEFPNYSEWHSSFSGAIECCGFAYLLGYRVYGTVPNTWTKVYNMNNVKSGDVIQYGNANTSGHTIFVTGVSGDTITFVDCNANGNYSGANKVRTCGIKWDNTVEKNRPLFGYNFSYVLTSPEFDVDVDDILAVNVVGSQACFSWIPNVEASSYDIKIWKDKLYKGDAYEIKWRYTGTEYIFALPNGTYQAYVDTIVADKCIMSNVVNFTIENTSPELKVQVNGSQVYLNWADDYRANKYTLKIYNGHVWESSEYEVFWNLDKTDEALALPAGTYQAYVDACGENYIKMSNIIEFTIGNVEPKLDVTVDKNNVYFDWNADKKAESYSLKIYKGNVWHSEEYKSIWNIDTTNYILKLPAGTYQAYVDACGNEYLQMGNVIEFEVVADKFTPTIAYDMILLDTDEYIYDGTEKCPTVTITDNEYVLKENIDYLISYSDNVNVGIAKLTITGIGDYDGIVEKTFKINKTMQIIGDANDDGDVNIQDATIVQMIVAKYPVEKINEKLADYDQNGEINIRDATSIQMIVAKLV